LAKQDMTPHNSLCGGQFTLGICYCMKTILTKKKAIFESGYFVDEFSNMVMLETTTALLND